MIKKNLVLVLLAFGISSAAYGQIKERSKTSSYRFHYSALAGIGRSYFKTSSSGPSKFPTPEIRIGGSAYWSLGEHFEVGTRLVFGLKAKVEKANKPGQPYVYYGPYYDLDDMVSRNHFFFEIPVIFQYHFLHPRINLGTGISYRQFFNRSHDQPLFDPLNGKKEVGIVGRVGYRINGRISIAIEQYLGLSDVYSSSGFIDGEEVYITARNRYSQITFEYRLSKN